MDTISRENTSYLPVAGVIVGVLALVLAAVALAKVSSNGKTVAAHTEQLGRVDTIETEARTAITNSEKANSNIAALRREIVEAMNQASLQIGTVQGEVAKLQESVKAGVRPSGSAGGSKTAPAVAGPDEYVVKAGDNGAKIARTAGISLPDLVAVNPGVNWSKLAIGAKVKLPKKN